MGLILILLACALGVRLFIVQIINGKDMQIRALDQWTRDLSLVAPRGNIYYSTCDTLAVSYTTYNVYVRGREVVDASLTAEKLSNLLDLNYESTLKKVQNKNVSESLLKMPVDADIAEGQRIGVQGTPYFLINNLVARGALSSDLFKEAINMALQAAPSGQK